jgi:hypothetical protein
MKYIEIKCLDSTLQQIEVVTKVSLPAAPQKNL